MITKDELLEIKEKIDLGLVSSNSQEFSDFLEQLSFYEHNPDLQKRYAKSLELNLETDEALDLSEKFLKKKNKDILKNFSTLFLVAMSDDPLLTIGLISMATSENDDAFFLMLLACSIVQPKQFVDNSKHIKQMKYFEKLNKKLELQELKDAQLESYVDNMLALSKVENSQYAYNEKPFPVDKILKPFEYLSDKQKSIVLQSVYKNPEFSLELNPKEKEYLREFAPGEKGGNKPNAPRPLMTPKMEMKSWK